MQRWQPRWPDGPDPMNQLWDAGPATADHVTPEPLPRPEADPEPPAGHRATAARAGTVAAASEPASELRRARACHMLALVRADAAAERAIQAAASWDKPLPGDPGFEAG